MLTSSKRFFSKQIFWACRSRLPQVITSTMLCQSELTSGTAAVKVLMQSATPVFEKNINKYVYRKQPHQDQHQDIRIINDIKQ